MGQLLNIFRLLSMCSLTLSLVNCQSSFPCPDPEEISPCICKLDEATQLMTLDCSTVQSTQQLETVFSADFPFFHFEVFRMVNMPDRACPVDSLPDGIFQNVTFDRIYIIGALIASVGENVFENSYSVMKSIRIQYTMLTLFPFHKISSFSTLTSIQLDKNDISTVTDIYSQTLQAISISYNPHLYISKNAFLNTPNVIALEFTGSGQPAIPEGLFSTLGKLYYINFGQNNLTILETNSFKLPNNTLTYLDFLYNDITTVQPGAIQGLDSSCDLYFTSNSITTLDEEVWRPIFEVLGETDHSPQIFLDYNPLDCGCSIAWLVSNYTLLKEISFDAQCANNGPLVRTLDPVFYNVNC